MKQIKTIVDRLDNSTTFDEKVNTAIKNGWRLIKREVLQQRQPHTRDIYFHSMLYAELVKNITETKESADA